MNGSKFIPLLGKNWPKPENYSKLLGFFNKQKKIHPPPQISGYATASHIPLAR